MQTTSTLRELEPAEIEEISGGNPLGGILLGGSLGGLYGGLSYSYTSSISGSEFTWTGLTGAVLQGVVTGALFAGGAYLFSVSGGTVAGVSAEALAVVIDTTDPGQSLQ